jgi:hypothetical protein
LVCSTSASTIDHAVQKDLKQMVIIGLYKSSRFQTSSKADKKDHNERFALWIVSKSNSSTCKYQIERKGRMLIRTEAANSSDSMVDTSILFQKQAPFETESFCITQWLDQVEPINTVSPKQSSSPLTAESPFRKRGIKAGNSYNAKGLAQAKAGSWNKALVCWENALEIRLQVLGESHLDVANTLNNIGIALGKLNRVDQAIDALGRALSIRVEHFGREHEQVASALHNLGNIFQQGNDLESAVKCFAESKKLNEVALGPHHVQVARACVAMGHVYQEANEHQDAIEAYHDALDIFELAGLDKDDVEVQNTLDGVDEVNRLLEKL